jgi:hypothetical protein
MEIEAEEPEVEFHLSGPHWLIAIEWREHLRLLGQSVENVGVLIW